MSGDRSILSARWCLLLGISIWSCQSVALQAAPLSFERDIRPILKTNCFQCHGEEKEIKGDLDVRMKRFLEKGGETGPAIVVGKPEESLLIEQLEKGKMPKKGKKVKPEDIEKIAQWIREGAKTLRAEPEKLAPGPVITEEDRSYWAFQPIRNPCVMAGGIAESHRRLSEGQAHARGTDAFA